MLSDFFNNFILDSWRHDVAPHLSALRDSTVFWCVAGGLLVGLLIYQKVRKK